MQRDRFLLGACHVAELTVHLEDLADALFVNLGLRTMGQLQDVVDMQRDRFLLGECHVAKLTVHQEINSESVERSGVSIS